VLVERQGLRRRPSGCIGSASSTPASSAGVDTLCGSVLFGFNALQLVSPGRAARFDAGTRRHQHRRGRRLRPCSERVDAGDGAGLAPLGYGESSDAHLNVDAASRRASAPSARSTTRLRPRRHRRDAVDHINLHGTASQRNDEVEAALVARRFPTRTHAVSTWASPGHTLGAAGIVEAAASLLAIEHGFLPAWPERARSIRCGPQNPDRAVPRRGRLALQAIVRLRLEQHASWCSDAVAGRREQ
jgi:3-oxoacyl-[acyl-carrier-protein] synthase-1